MSYGTIKSSEGVDLSTDGLKQIQVGQCVEGNTITSLEMAEDQNGNVNEKRAVLLNGSFSIEAKEKGMVHRFTITYNNE